MARQRINVAAAFTRRDPAFALEQVDQFVRHRVVGDVRGVDPQLVASLNRHTARRSGETDVDHASVELGEKSPYIEKPFENFVACAVVKKHARRSKMSGRGVRFGREGEREL